MTLPTTAGFTAGPTLSARLEAIGSHPARHPARHIQETTSEAVRTLDWYLARIATLESERAELRAALEDVAEYLDRAEHRVDVREMREAATAARLALSRAEGKVAR